MTKLDHIASPDGKAFIYQTSYPIDEAFQTSVATWILMPGGSGGGGVLDLKSNKPMPVTFEWTSDSTVLIQYDSAATVLRMENDSYYLGRRTKFDYKVKK
ncbi:MAG: hypothetical protein AAF740_08620 [Bacteroidota bacterium]